MFFRVLVDRFLWVYVSRCGVYSNFVLYRLHSKCLMKCPLLLPNLWALECYGRWANSFRSCYGRWANSFRSCFAVGLSREKKSEIRLMGWPMIIMWFRFTSHGLNCDFGGAAAVTTTNTSKTISLYFPDKDGTFFFVPVVLHMMSFQWYFCFLSFQGLLYIM